MEEYIRLGSVADKIQEPFNVKLVMNVVREVVADNFEDVEEINQYLHTLIEKIRAEYGLRMR